MKQIMLIGLLLVLCGCQAQPAWEVVEDLQPAGEIIRWQETSCDIELSLPEEAVLTEQNPNEMLYELGSAEIMTTRFLASDYASAVEYLTGYEAENLNILQTARFDIPEYQFTWYSQTEEGGRLYRADLLVDGITCYAVVCSVPETDGTFNEQVRQVFSSFSLSQSELV